MPGNPGQGTAPGDLYRQGMALIQRGQHGQAVRVLAGLVRVPLDPWHRALAHRALGVALLGVGHPAEAVEALRVAEAAMPADKDIPAMLARALRALGRYEESLAACGRCLELDPGRVGVIGLESEMLVRLRCDAEARARIDDADRRGVVDPDIDVARSSLALRAGDLDDAAGKLRRHLETDLAGPRRALVGFSLGDVLDAAGRYDEAWRAYADANAGLTGEFRPDLFQRDAERIVRAWGHGQIERLRAGASSDERPVLVVGMPRSGTTLIESIVGAHPLIVAGGELKTLGECTMVIGRATQSPPETTPERITAPMITQAAEHYTRTLDRLAGGATRVTNKLPMNAIALGVFAAMFPRGRIIHCRRDPRDTCLSCFCRMFREPAPFTNRLDWAAAYYRSYATLMDHWRSELAHLRDAPVLCEVRYEDLVTNPEPTAREIVGALGVEWDPACLRVGREGPTGVTLRADQGGRGIYTSSVGKHERYATHLAPLTEALADLIEAYNTPNGGA